MRVVAVALSLGAVACGRLSFDAITGGASGDDGGADGTADARVLPSGIVAWVPFDDDLSDGAEVFGPGYAAGAQAACDGSCPGMAGGKIGGAGVFGTNVLLRLADSPQLRLDHGTIAAWFRPTSLPVEPDLFQLVGKPYGPLTEDSYELYFVHGTTLPEIGVGGDSDTGGPYVQGQYTPALGTWTHVAATWDGAMERVYVNGVERATDVAFSKLYDTSDVLIGADIDNGMNVNFVGGEIDDLRIYDVALPETDLMALATP